jgi:RimJ/RimL family protein N-acetyltransferase
MDMYSRPEVYRFLGAAPSPVRDLDDARARIEAFGARTRGLDGIWAISRRGDEAAIGAVLLVPLPRSDEEPSDAREIGWHLHPEVWGRGFATEAARAVVQRAREGGLSEVRAVVHAGNAASHAVCRRLGMSEIGLTREWYGTEVVEYRLDLGGAVRAAVVGSDEWLVARALRLAALAESPDAFAGDLAAELSADETEWRTRLAADTWIAGRVGGEALGVLALTAPYARHDADGWIHSWWVAPAARGRGLARAMLALIDAQARARGWSRLGLGVWAENAEAISAFAAMGFMAQEPRPSSRYAGRHYVAMLRDVPRERPAG